MRAPLDQLRQSGLNSSHPTLRERHFKSTLCEEQSVGGGVRVGPLEGGSIIKETDKLERVCYNSFNEPRSYR